MGQILLDIGQYVAYEIWEAQEVSPVNTLVTMLNDVLTSRMSSCPGKLHVPIELRKQSQFWRINGWSL